MSTTTLGSEVSGMSSRSRRDEQFTDYLHARQGALLRTAFLICGDPHLAEDVLQTALAKLYLSWEKVRDRESVDAYVRRIIVNETTSLWRRPWRRNEFATELGDRDLDDRHHDTYDEGDAAAVWELVSTLPARARAVVVLRYYEQLSEAETAEVLGISRGTVKSQCNRALTLLRERVPDGLPHDHTLRTQPRQDER